VGLMYYFLTCAEFTNSILITDDRKQYEKAKGYGLRAEFLRDKN